MKETQTGPKGFEKVMILTNEGKATTEKKRCNN